MFNFESPPGTVSAGQVRALRRFCVAEGLLDVGNDSAAGFAGEGREEEFGADLRGTSYGCRDGGEGANLGGAE